MMKDGSSDYLRFGVGVWGGISLQVYKLHTFEEFILYNFALRDVFLHNGKLDALLLSA